MNVLLWRCFTGKPWSTKRNLGQISVEDQVCVFGQNFLTSLFSWLALFFLVWQFKCRWYARSSVILNIGQSDLIFYLYHTSVVTSVNRNNIRRSSCWWPGVWGSTSKAAPQPLTSTNIYQRWDQEREVTRSNSRETVFSTKFTII